MKFYMITAKNMYDSTDAFVIMSPTESNGSVDHDISWEQASSYDKYGTFNFIIVVNEQEKKDIEAFWTGEEGTEKFVKGNSAKDWKHIKNSSYHNEIQFKEMKVA